MANLDFLPPAAVIILTWNQKTLTMECLESVFASEYPSEQLFVYVVDNGSTDGTVEAIRQRFPKATVVANGSNLGFAEGNNSAIQCALNSPAQYIMLLNNDTVVGREMLRELVEVGERDSGIGITTAKIYYMDEPTRIWCAGAEMEPFYLVSRRLRAEQLDGGEAEAVRDVAFASGCAMCVKRGVIEQIGVFDSRFFLYYEEGDWCQRAKAVGWRIAYVPSAHVWHKVSATMGSSSPVVDYYMTRNRFLFLRKHQPVPQCWIAAVRIAARDVKTIIAYSVKPRGGSRTRNRNARLLALRDAALGRWGRMGADVAAVCSPPCQ